MLVDAQAPDFLILRIDGKTSVLLDKSEAARVVAELLQVACVRGALVELGDACELVTSSRAGVVVATVRLR